MSRQISSISMNTALLKCTIQQLLQVETSNLVNGSNVIPDHRTPPGVWMWRPLPHEVGNGSIALPKQLA
jgi:hypothetical protein